MGGRIIVFILCVMATIYIFCMANTYHVDALFMVGALMSCILTGVLLNGLGKFMELKRPVKCEVEVKLTILADGTKMLTFKKRGHISFVYINEDDEERLRASEIL